MHSRTDDYSVILITFNIYLILIDLVNTSIRKRNVGLNFGLMFTYLFVIRSIVPNKKKALKAIAVNGRHSWLFTSSTTDHKTNSMHLLFISCLWWRSNLFHTFFHIRSLSLFTFSKNSIFRIFERYFILISDSINMH